MFSMVSEKTCDLSNFDPGGCGRFENFRKCFLGFFRQNYSLQQNGPVRAVPGSEIDLISEVKRD